MFFFPSQIYLKPTFYTAQNFLYQLRFFVLPVLLLNWNKTCCIDLFLARFVKLLNIRLDECSLFLGHLRSVFLIVIGRKQNIPVFLYRKIISKLFRVTANAQGRKFIFEEGLKASLTSDSQVDCLCRINFLRDLFGPLL